MTITEFLLARITEDEEQAEYVQAYGSYGPLEILRPTRVLAECAAKRAIVEGVLELERNPNTRLNALLYAQYKQWSHWFIRPFAAVYATHADYQQEWKP